MKKVNKTVVIPPKLQVYFENNPTKSWEDFKKGNKNRYKEVLAQLKKDQGGICCYCENNFHNYIDNEGDFRVEHFHPKSDTCDPSINWNLIWTNLFGCCSGGNQNVEKPDFLTQRYIPQHEYRHCDVLKDDNIWDDIILNPLDIPAFPPIFHVSSANGEMSVIEENCNQCNIDIQKANNCLDEKKLNLNAPKLIEWRESVIDILRNQINDEYEDSVIEVLSAHLSKDSNGNYSPFFTTIRSYLEENAEKFLNENNYSTNKK
ncbi:MAG: TIGR02646 family protein [Bacteroidales bacterium]|nr:TIGR02646 family protein [Bacteroidales bacterium]